ncbi:MAG: class I SAM-dependent methyltransferase [Stellaceae bacterium]
MKVGDCGQLSERDVADHDDDLLDPRGDGRFRFGENWQSFLDTITDEAIAEAERGMNRLFPNGEIRGASLLDIGSGSGLSALAACRLGARVVDAIDIDPQSVAATEAVLSKFVHGSKWSVQRQDLFEVPSEQPQAYDIVYSWGVLHHTEAMWNAVDRAAAMVRPQGHLAIALYHRTPLCPLWRLEKRFYAQAGEKAQTAIRSLYKALYRSALLATLRNPNRYIAAYRSARGMDWHHDVHDWLGGYPYDSTNSAAVVAHLKELRFVPQQIFEHEAPAFGLFGSHCDEYVFRRLH